MMKNKFKIGEKVWTRFGFGVVAHIREDSMTIVVNLESGDQMALLKTEVKKEK